MTRKRAAITKHGRGMIDGVRYATVVRLQRSAARVMAYKIEQGEGISTTDVVAMLRARALQPWRGRPPKQITRSEQRAAILRAADCLERGEPFDAPTVADALRKWADALRSSPPARMGRPMKVDHVTIALEFESQRRRRPDTAAAKIVAELAEKYGVDESTIKEARIACGDAAKRHFDVLFADFGATWNK